MKKTIFISDIHMGTEESVKNKYGWLWDDRATLLAQFLDKVLSDSSVDETVIAGDLFDEWVVPYGTNPVPSPDDHKAQFVAIAKASQNKPAIGKLKELASSGRLTYVPGNHDMFASADIVRSILGENTKCIYDGPGKGVYQNGVLVAEHGSEYTLFNAPDTWDYESKSPDKSARSTPMGFFEARVMAEAVLNGTPITYDRYKYLVLEALIKLIEGESFSDAVYKAMIKESDIKCETLEMNMFDGWTQQTTQTVAASTFKNLYDKWDKEHEESPIFATLAAIGDAGYLAPASVLTWKAKDKKVALFGHTHQWDLVGMTTDSIFAGTEALFKAILHLSVSELEAAIKKFDAGANVPADFIYVNSGTWINGTAGGKGEGGMVNIPPPATYVVVQSIPDRTEVLVYQYEGGSLYDEKDHLGTRYMNRGI